MRDAVVVHDLNATKLRVGGVDLATQQLIQSRRASQNDRGVFNLFFFVENEMMTQAI